MYLHLYLTSAANGGGCSASRPGREEKLRYAPNRSLDGLHSLFGRFGEFKTTQISSVYRKSKSDSSVVQSVALKLYRPRYVVV